MPLLTALRAQNFRCFGQLACEFGPGAHVFVGDNAQGKTSILEAMCVLLRLQSPRAGTLAELARFDESPAPASPAFGLSGDLLFPAGTGPEESRRLTVQWQDGQRRLGVDSEHGLSPSRYLARSAVLVWMGNDDLALVRGPGEGRRRYLDFLGSQTFPGYRQAQLAYDKALRSRNRLLKDDRPDARAIAAYTAPLLEHGTALTHFRRELIATAAPWAAASHRDISEADETLALTYHSGATEDFATALAASVAEENRRRLTVVGPHRDDLLLTLNGRPSAAYASEGQQRTIALALKLAQALHLTAHHGEPPLLLIDDVFGELDPRRRNALLRSLPSGSQQLITTTHLGWLEALSPAPTVCHVSQGRISAAA